MKQAVRLDEQDRKILRIIQRRGDLSHAALAEEVGMSAASCWRRLKQLEATGVLRGVVCLVDPDAVDCGHDVLCQVRMRSHDQEARGAFERFAQAHDQIMECYSMSGEWDYLLRIVVGDIHDYERLLMQEILTQKGVAASSSHFALRRIKYKTALPV